MVRAVVLIVIDCLRADHVRAYGYHRATTPTIDGLAARGILFEQAQSPSSWTKPAVTSLLTGLYPSEHGAFLGVKRSKGQLAATTDILRSPRPTLAESFASAGWRCGAFLNNAQLGEFTQLNRGFDPYHPHSGKADHLIELFEDWLTQDATRPAFAYLHFLEAHWPYKPRRRHIAEFGGDRDTNCFRDFSARDFGKLRRAVSRKERTLTDDELAQMVQMYDGAVRRLDGKVKRVLGILREQGLEEQSALFVTADHGDEFLDHGRIGHGHSLYEELTHVPLIACVPDHPRGLRRSQPVTLLDLPATMLRAAGVSHELGCADLLAEDGPTSPTFAELCIRHRYSQALRHDRWKLHRRFKFLPPDGQIADTTRSRRQWLDLYPHEVSCELYDIHTDPHECNNLADQPEHSAVRDDMLDRLERCWQSHGTPLEGASPAEVEIDERVVTRLRDLGYLD